MVRSKRVVSRKQRKYILLRSFLLSAYVLYKTLVKKVGSEWVKSIYQQRAISGHHSALLPHLPENYHDLFFNFTRMSVIGNTGEDKHEEIFFNKRGKLFYFYSGQWKEKGVGYIQIIFYRGLKAAFLKITKQNCTKLMVPTYYVYQHISSCMKIHPFQKSDKAFSWFAENELRYEHLCICFKTADIAAAFKAAFEKVLNILKENKIGNITNLVIKSTTDTYPVTQQPYGTRSLPKADSWTCPVCYTNNAADKLVCVVCQAKKPGSQATSASNSITTITSSTKSNANLFTFNVNDACSVSSPKSTFSGFTFWPSPVLKEVKPASTSIPIASSSGNSTANQFTLGENSAVFASVINQNNMFDGLTFSTVPMIKDKKTVSPSISVATSTSNSTANLFSFNQNSAVISSVSEQRNISQGLTFFTERRIKKTKTDTKARGTLVASTKSEKCQASSYFGFSCVSSHSTAVTSSLAGLKPVCHYDRNQSVITTGRSAASTENNISKMNSVLPNINFVNTLYSRSSESFATFSNYNACASNCASLSNASAYSLPSHNNVSTEDQKMSTNIINDFAYKFATAAEVKPIVSLPALVEVKSSEDEKELFGEQAKLLRFDFDEKEWKKYCTGELKILYLKARKMGRISMRTGKLCTNQYIFPHMQLTPLANNNEAWIWYAEDVSDGELKKEMFAAKFKSTEIAQEFFKTFHACQSKLDEITEEKKLHLDDKFQPGAYMGNKKIFDEQPSTCTEKASPGLLGTIKHSSVGFPSEIKPLTQSTALPFFGLSSVAEASATAGFKSVFPANNAARGGLTQKSEISEIKSVPIPLATDSFESSASLSKFNVDLSASSKKSDASLFGSVERPKGCEFNFKGSLYGNAKTLMASIPTPSCIDDEDEEDSFDKCLPPDVPLPPEADDNFLNEIEEVTFYGPGILFSFSNGDWKKQGIGNIKICVYRLTKKAPRLLMQEEGVSNLCADHYFTSNMELHCLKNSERVFFWLAVVHTVEGMRLQHLCVCFRTINIAAAFKTAFKEALKIAKENEAEVKSTTNASPVTQKPFGVTFLPKDSSWTCQTCYVSNAADKLLCVACETKKRGSQVTAGSNSISVSTSITNSTANQFTFSINSFSQRFKVTSVSGSKNTLGVSTFSASPVMPEKKSVIKSRAMLLAVRKKYEKTCRVTEVTAPKPCPFTAPKPSPFSGFSFSPPTAVVSSSSTVPSSSDFGKFQWGSSVQSTSSTEKTSPFSFGSNKPSSGDFLFGMKPITQSTTFSFGLSSVIGKGSETVGFKPTLPTSNTPAVFGGTTQKSDLLEKKSITIPQTTSAPTDAFGNTSSTSIFSFGSPAGKEADSSFVEFRFGSPQKYEFNFSGVRPRSPTKTPVCPKSSSIPSDVVQPAIPLPPKVETGEENEEVMFCKRARLFRFFAGEWKERGIGNMKVLFGRNSKKARLLMRRDLVLKVCLNHLLNKEIVLEWRGNKSLTWTAIDFSENEASPELFAIRFRTNELAQQFKDAIDDALKLNALAGESEVSSEQACTTTKVVTNVSFKSDSSVKTEPPFNAGSLSACFGTTLQGKSLFGNSANVLGTTETKPSSSVSPFFQTDKLGTNSVFGQNVNFSTNSLKSIFGGHGLKFGLDIYDDVEKTSASKFTELTVQSQYRGIELTAQLAASVLKLCTAHSTPQSENSELFAASVKSVTFADLATNSSFKSLAKLSSTKIFLLLLELHFLFNANNSTEEAGAPTEQKSEDKDLTKIKVSDSTMQKRENSVISQKTSSPLEAENKHVVLEFETNEHNSNEESEEGDFIFEKRVPFEAFDESSDQFKTGKPEKESEEVIFCEPAALFCYTSREGNVRGVGDIKVLFNGVSKKAHLVMRKEHVLKVCLNRYIVKEMSFEWWDEKSMKWAAIDFFNNKPSCEIFAVQFETSALAYKFKEAIEYAMKLIKEAEISGDQTPRTTEDLVNLPIRSNFSIKTNSPFTESVSTCLGETWQDKPFFGNSRSANFSEDTTSVFSPGLELSLKNKFTAFPAFTQHSNFSANNSKPVFQSFGFKFETDDFADEGKHSILTEESIVLDDSADEEKHSLSTEKSTYYSADEGKLSLSTEENIDESPDDGKHSLPKFSEINECSLHSENSKDTCMTFVKSAVFSDLSTHSTFEDISKPSSAKNISSSDENLFVSSADASRLADASTVTSEDGSADDGKHSLPKFSEANVGSLCSENSKDTCTTFVKNAVFSDLATHSTSEDISKPSSMKGVSSSDENLLVSSADTSATSEAS